MDISYQVYKDSLVELRAPGRLQGQQGGVRTFRGKFSKGGRSITIFMSVDIEPVAALLDAKLRMIRGGPLKMSGMGMETEVARQGKCAFGDGGVEKITVGNNTVLGLRNYHWSACFARDGCNIIWDIKCVEGAPGSMELEEFDAVGQIIVESIRVSSDPAAKPKPPEAGREQSDDAPGRNNFDSEAVDHMFRMVSHMSGKKSRSQAVPSAEDILSQLDQCAAAFNFPILDNGYVYLADVRISAYRDKKRWAMIIETLGYNPRASGIQSFSSSLYCFGNCLKGTPGLDNDSWVYPISDGPDGPLLDEANSLNEGAKSLRIRETVVRINRDAAFLAGKKIGRKFDIENWRAYAMRQKGPLRKNLLDAARPIEDAGGAEEFRGQDLLRSLVPEHRNLLLATDGELSQRLSVELPLLLRLDQWHHPDVSAGEMPSKSEAFKMIAEVLATGDASRYKPTQEPNTHWSNWPSGGDL